MVSDKKVEEIKAGARDILDKFAKALDKVKVNGEKIKKPYGGYRSEELGTMADGEFREIMFANASEKKGDCIIVGKKKWK